MNLPHTRPVDDDDALGRRLANLARLGAAVGVLMFLLFVGVLTVYTGSASRSPVMSSVSDHVAADAAPALRALPTEPNQHDHAQRPYMTHGG